MQATLTSKGQITIPVKIREKLRLRPGDVIDFDPDAPYLKGVKAIPESAWDRVAETWEDPWGSRTTEDVLDELRGPADLPGTPDADRG